jgi:glucose/arabinose dehydrogenase
LYYAYGIRNSFGINFDPVTGNLWDTENGPVGQFITANLGTAQTVCSVDIAWFNGNSRQYHFVISTSTDGNTFTQRFSGDSSGTTLNSEKYTFAAVDARFVRVTVNGNNVNTWASITELDVFGSSTPRSECTTNLPISDVTASGNDSNVPSNVLDNNLGTRWSSLGVDEINLVEPGFNSGWDKVMGKSSFQKNFTDPDLVDFDGKGRYSDPEFVWNQTIGVTDLIFLNSDKLGKKYQNDLFVADDNFGNIYHFKLNGTRTGLLPNDTLQDKIANMGETKGIIFAKGFGGITDLEVGLDGNLYVLSRNDGAIYRISNQGTTRLEPKPTTTDPNLKIEQVVGTDKLKSPSSMAFLDSNDILILNKDNGTVKRIINGSIQPQPLLDANVSINSGRGMLGIDVAKFNINGTTVPYVFLYYTESKNKDAEDVEEGIPPLGNRVYRYELVNDKLVNPKLLLDLPSTPTNLHSDSLHTGGKVVIGPDQNVYAVIGDVGGEGPGHKTLAQNVKNGTQADGTSGILRVTQDGKVVGKGILGNTYPLSLYYAYGIRNSFGINFDPVTGNLWDSENGPEYGDEINLVEPGFNSGYIIIDGFNSAFNHNFESSLVDFDGKGRYGDPEFVWNQPIGVTDLIFLNSDKLGKQYQNDLFVADFNFGNIYHFKLNGTRTGLLLNDTLQDKIANTRGETKGIIFAKGFGGITDLEVGPDGNLYVLSRIHGTIYRISHN